MRFSAAVRRATISCALVKKRTALVALTVHRPPISSVMPTFMAAPPRFSLGMLLAGFLTLSSPRQSLAQATVKVPPTSSIYETLDALAAAGLIKDLIFGQRPLARATIARLIVEASVRLDSLADLPPVALQSHEDARSLRSKLRLADAERRVIDALKVEYQSEIRMIGARRDSSPGLVWLHRLEVDALRATSPTRRVPSNNLAGAQIDAVINPLLANVEGRRLEQGNNGALEGMSAIESPHLAVELRPRVWTGANGAGETRGTLSLEELQARLVFGNVAIDAGRQYAVWGQGLDVGLINSNNSPALDLGELSTENPVRLPWVLGDLGLGRFSLFVADLGSQQNFPGALLIGYKFSFLPTSNLEIGTVVYTKEGGRGSPTASLSARLVDLFPFLDRSAYNNRIGAGGNFEFSHHFAGLDTRWRVPHAAGVTAFAEVTLNDFDTRRIGSVLWEDAGHVFGVAVPQFSTTRSVSMSFEYHHTGIRYYEHQTYVTGQTLRETLTGDPLGPDAIGSYANLEWHAAPRHALHLELALERRSNDQYAVVPVFRFVRTEGRPKERRQRAIVRWVGEPMPGGIGVLAGVGVERATNFAFVAGNDRVNGLAQLGLQWSFR